MERRVWLRNYDYNVPATIRYPKFPIQDLVHLAAAQFPHKAAIDFYGSALTFRQVRDQVLRLANAFIRFGVKKGDRIGIILPNCPQYVIIAYYDALSAGAIVVNMNPQDTYDDLKFMMENTGLKTVVTFDGALSTMRPLALELGLKQMIVTRPQSGRGGDACIPDPYRGETIKAFIVPKEGQRAMEIEIIKFCQERLPRHKVPEVVEFRNSIPKSAVGKILRRVLREEESAKNKGKPKFFLKQEKAMSKSKQSVA